MAAFGSVLPSVAARWRCCRIFFCRILRDFNFSEFSFHVSCANVWFFSYFGYFSSMDWDFLTSGMNSCALDWLRIWQVI